MNLFADGGFWAALLLGAVACYLLSPDRENWRAAALAVISGAALWHILGLSTASLAILGGSILWVSLAAAYGVKKPSTRPNTKTFFVMLPVILAWIAGKEAGAFTLTTLEPFAFFGFSFLLVKAWTLVREANDGVLERFSPPVAVAYFLYFPTYVSGPMHYYSEFEAAMRRPTPPSGVGLVDAVYRIVLGFTKVSVLAPLFTPVSLAAIQGVNDLTLKSLLLGAGGYSLVLLFDFSGYSDIAIGTSRLIGVDVPENFRWPYLSANLREFWQRWHMSFTRVLTGFVFVPLSRALTSRLPNRPRIVVVLVYLVTFGFCGYWHGATLGFVVWGLYHAAGLVVYDFYRSAAVKRRLATKRPPAKGMRASAARLVSTAATFCFVSLGWIPFVIPVPMLLAKLRGAG